MKTANAPVILFGISILSGIALRGTMTNEPHSGQSKPPMFGDYEAQRHWMEITLHLPIRSWYRNTTENNLQYWGLDYPPITAYHSLIMGYAASRQNSSWVELHKSRGEESYSHKVFMRSTVLLADALIYLPACYFLALHSGITLSIEGAAFMMLMLISYPGLVLIDHGHFQYNGISLGLFLISVAFLHRHQDILASVFFCCALGYKQMMLYFALPIFLFLFGKCCSLNIFAGVKKLTMLGLTVVLSFSVIFSPFLFSLDDIGAVLVRLFPFARGLYEDKVANVWCSLSAVIKLREILSQPQLLTLCAASTLAMHLPSAWVLMLRRPGSLRGLRFALSACSLTFFLFSYQVHEKSILMPGVATMLLGAEQPWVALHFSIISTASMWPLLLKDGLALATVTVCVLHSMASILLYPSRRPSSFAMTLFTLSISGFATLIGCSIFIPAPKTLPDIHALFISAYSCSHFLLYLLYFNAVLVLEVGCLLPKKGKMKTR